MASEYEKNVGKLLTEKNRQLQKLQQKTLSSSSSINKEEIERLKTEIETLESLFDNYNLGMNYFRRARGGRSGLRE
jgi:colicin import membrane protein